MHAYRRFVQTEMDKRGWTAADLQRSSGLTKQNLSRLLRDEREQLQQRPDTETVHALARAFGVSDELVLSHVAEAMGLPTNRVEVAAAADLSNEELLRILAERLNRGGTHEPAPDPAATAPAPNRDDLADPAQPDGAIASWGIPDTPDERTAMVDRLRRVNLAELNAEDLRKVQAIVDELGRLPLLGDDEVFMEKVRAALRELPFTLRADLATHPGADERPWEQDEYGLAAKRGRNRGREARQRQDHDAEDGGA